MAKLAKGEEEQGGKEMKSRVLHGIAQRVVLISTNERRNNAVH